jgi:DNA polymerase delta subunit 1
VLYLMPQGALQRILMQADVPSAVSFVEGEITRLLTGHVGVWELAMTGGLWRVTGQQLEKAAAAGELLVTTDNAALTFWQHR